LGILSIENYITAKINFEEIIDTFAEQRKNVAIPTYIKILFN
jgi:hypothetical protein